MADTWPTVNSGRFSSSRGSDATAHLREMAQGPRGRSRAGPWQGTSGSGGDGRLGLGLDLDLARQGLLGQRNANGQDTAVVAGVDLLRVNRVGEPDPPS